MKNNFSVDFPLIESCCETLQEVIDAENNGADRIEFCTSLSLQGLTPKVSDVKLALSKINIPLRVIIRPENEFYATKSAISAMIDSIREFSNLEIEGFVLGLLNQNNRLDYLALEKILCETSNLPITFHKAIDHSSQILKDVSILNNYPTVDYILTSGGAQNASEGRKMILKMQDLFDCSIMAGGSITHENLETIRKSMPLKAFHGRRIV